ncbi:hypothetical protein U0070_016302 [Myodes glareolus]|uniref:Protein CDV3 homolog n=1 Tax=Myodes glareolus TaxID=447135 RepID=A0AAW0HJ41_MYOGA
MNKAVPRWRERPKKPILDNFFAKRDKKKERSSWAARQPAPGWVTAGDRAPALGPASPACKAIPKDEDEWNEFEQKEVDNSGLRVQAMQISEKEDDGNEKREDPGDNWEEGGGGSGVEKSSGPWNSTAPVQVPPAPVIVTGTSVGNA